MTLPVLRCTSQVFYRKPLNLGSSEVSAMIWLGFWKEPQRGDRPFSLHHTRVPWHSHDITGDVDPDPRIEGVPAISPLKVSLLFPFPVFLKWVAESGPHSRVYVGGSISSCPGKARVCRCYLGSSYRGDLPLTLSPAAANGVYMVSFPCFYFPFDSLYLRRNSCKQHITGSYF